MTENAKETVFAIGCIAAVVVGGWLIFSAISGMSERRAKELAAAEGVPACSAGYRVTTPGEDGYFCVKSQP